VLTHASTLSSSHVWNARTAIEAVGMLIFALHSHQKLVTIATVQYILIIGLQGIVKNKDKVTVANHKALRHAYAGRAKTPEYIHVKGFGLK